MIEEELAQIGTKRFLKEFLSYRIPGPIFLPKGKWFGKPVDSDSTTDLPFWLSEEDFNYYVTKYEKTGFTGGINYYRNMDRYIHFLFIFYNKVMILSFYLT